MNLFALSSLLVLAPIALQVIVGSIALYNRIKFTFGQVTLFNTVSLFAMIFVGLEIVNKDAQNQNVRCGMPGVAFFFFGLIMLVVFLITVVIQLVIRKMIIKRK